VTLPASALPDETLALRAQQGDRQAFETLIGRHKDALYRLVRRYLGNSDDAYDLLQDTFISVWENLHRYDPKRSFVAWARTIALNKCRDFSRRRRFRQWVSQLFAAEPTAETLSPAELADLGEAEAREGNRLRRLDEAIAALPELYKEPLLLTTVGGLSQEAAAAVLRTTTKAVEMRLRRARQKLIEALSPSAEG
jgi:RNA polymerase sigma factor (sigma-70 family)